MDGHVNKPRKNHSIGLAGGVLSVAGLCVGILSIGRKTDRRSGAAPALSLPRQFELVEPLPEQECEPDKSGTPDVESMYPTPQPRSSREMITDLAEQGESVIAIAQRLGISVGEVQLTLNLKARTASASPNSGNESKKSSRHASNQVAK